jgi:hypothetical protein
LKKYNKPAQKLPKKPLILGLYDENLYNTIVIKELISMGIQFYISEMYSPEAGSSLILFDKRLVEKIKCNASLCEVDFIEVDSIDDLKAW